jgi:hypothetical protein
MRLAGFIPPAAPRARSLAGSRQWDVSMTNRLLVLLLLVLLAACTTPSTTETTPPSIAFVDGGKQITTLPLIDPASSTPVSFLYVAGDSGGVQSLALGFTNTVAICTVQFTGGVTASGSYPVMTVPAKCPLFPEELSQRS